MLRFIRAHPLVRTKRNATKIHSMVTALLDEGEWGAALPL